VSNQDGFLPQSRPNTGNDPYNILNFAISQMLSGINVATLVKVVAVNVAGLLVGTVDVQILVQQVDGAGTPIPSDTIYEVPFFRLQGGANAVIINPTVGDVGFAVFADRDISAVQASGAPNPPGSRRRFDLADALYIGGWCSNITPTQYIQFATGSILLETPAVNTPTKYEVAGIQVVKAQQPNIAPLTVTGAAADPIARAGVNAIMSLLQAHGLMA